LSLKENIEWPFIFTEDEEFTELPPPPPSHRFQIFFIYIFLRGPIAPHHEKKRRRRESETKPPWFVYIIPFPKQEILISVVIQLVAGILKG